MHAVAIGPFTTSQADTLASAATRAGVEVEIHSSFEEARIELERGEATPGCILANAEAPLRPIVSWVRARDGWFNLPVLALVPHPSERVFAEAFAMGADDAIVAHDSPGIQRRLANLLDHDPGARPPAQEGVALVASANIHKRRNLGKVLRQAGFSVSFAGEARDLMSASSAVPAPTLVVATPSFPPLGGEAAVRTVRTAAGNPRLPAIVLGSSETETSVSVRVTDPQEHGDEKGKLLFFAEEALRERSGKDQRASERLHYATICAFRMAGLMEPTYGLTHNISREGLFIRTLDPPPRSSEIWLELRTFDDETVHLRGTVMWRREADRVGGTAPPGFGVRLNAAKSPADDLERYVSSYLNLSRNRGNVN